MKAAVAVVVVVDVVVLAVVFCLNIQDSSHSNTIPYMQECFIIIKYHMFFDRRHR